MRKEWMKIVASALAVMLLAGCSQTQTPAQEPAESAPEQSTAADEMPEPSTEEGLLIAIDPGYSDRDLEMGYDADDVAASIVLSDDGTVISGNGAEVKDDVITISAEGVYVFEGTLSNGSIHVDAQKEDKVQIVLAGASIICENGPAIRIERADKVFLTALEGTENALTDGSSYEQEDGNACVYSDADLTVNGLGTLNVTGNYRHGIHSKDDLVVNVGTLVVTAVEDGLRGKDGVGIAEGEISITAGGDGIHSSGDTDREDRGWISLDGGNIAITAGEDGIQAATMLQVRGSAIDLNTGGGAANAQPHVQDEFGFGGGGFGGMMGGGKFDGTMPEPSEGMEMPKDGTMPEPPEGMEMPEDGTMPQPPEGMEMPEDGTMPELPEGMKMPMEGMEPTNAAGNASDSAEASASAKGLKSDGNLLVLSGSITADCADDALHASGDIRIAGGEFTIKTGDDGMHADGNLRIEAGTICIAEGYEGLEAHDMDVLGGSITICVSDDGINVTDTTGAQSNTFAAMEGVVLRIAGGELNITVASGDGLDSNGDVQMSGGSVFISGAVSGPDTALDYNGTAEITGGTIIGMGTAQLAMNFAGESKQCSELLTMDISEGAQLALADANGTELLSWVSEKSAQNLLISTPELVEGETYTILLNGQEAASFTAAISTQAGGMMGGFGGGRDNRKDGQDRGRRDRPDASQQPAETSDPA